MSAKEKYIANKSVSVYRGCKVALLAIEEAILMVLMVYLFYWSLFVNDGSNFIAVAVEVAVPILAFVAGSIFKEIRIRTNRES